MPVFKAVAERIEAAIAAGTLEPGLLLLEGPLSEVMGTSRTTVRSSLLLLAERGRVTKSAGKGFLIGTSVPADRQSRRKVLASDVPETAGTGLGTSPAADQIKDELAEVISMVVPFGHYRISEQRLADCFSVSRPVVREVLWRLKDVGLVEKELHASWLAGPLTGKAVSEDRELRTLIEPYALMLSAPLLSADDISLMRSNIDMAISSTGRVAHELLERIELDLHENCLRFFPNQRAWNVLRNGRLPIRVNALFARHVGIDSDDPGLDEHRAVLDCLIAGDFSGAAACHSRHLNREGQRTLERLKVLSVIPEPSLPSYLERIS